MTTVLCVFHPAPVDGYPPRYVRDAIPVIAQSSTGRSRCTRRPSICSTRR
ncbi:hypothetical protein [Burkholderia sp. BE17]|nr:hypothetical protein [Burkholderia sp. BE17]